MVKPVIPVDNPTLNQEMIFDYYYDAIVPKKSYYKQFDFRLMLAESSIQVVYNKDIYYIKIYKSMNLIKYDVEFLKDNNLLTIFSASLNDKNFGLGGVIHIIKRYYEKIHILF